MTASDTHVAGPQSPDRLDRLFAPRAVAVVGASRRPEAVGHSVVRNLLDGGFTGQIYPINPCAQSIAGLPCAPTIAATGAQIDLAVIAVRAEGVLEVVDQAADHGVRAFVILSAGFGEAGGEGVQRQAALARLARNRGLALVGPNCLGVINTAANVRLNASFATRMPPAGPLALISQSGALTTALLDYAGTRGLGFSKVVSFGNRAGLTEVELLDAAAADPETRCILLYLEDVSDGQRFLEVAERLCHGPGAKAILVLKAGRTSAGAQAAASHTGALAGSEALYDGLFSQAGVMQVESVEALFDAAVIFASSKRPAGGRTMIVTNAGGPGILATDACAKAGLPLAQPSQAFLEGIVHHLPDTSRAANPLDLIGDARHDRYAAAVSLAIADHEVDQILVILTPQRGTGVEAVAQDVGRLAAGTPKPVAACFMGGGDVAGGVATLRRWGIPTYAFPENAVQALARLAGWASESRRPLGAQVDAVAVDAAGARALVDAELSAGRHELVEVKALELLSRYRLPVIPWRLAADEDAAAMAAAELGYPVAVKIASPDVLHKTELGGVHLGLGQEQQVRNAFRAITAAFRGHVPGGTLWGAIVQKMAPQGRELIIGFKRDPRLGPMIMLGAGGIWTEVLRDSVFRHAPLRRGEVERMIAGLRTLPLLKGKRGQGPIDFAALADALRRTMQLALDEPRIAELDLNPAIAMPSGLLVVDARILLRAGEDQHGHA